MTKSGMGTWDWDVGLGLGDVGRWTQDSGLGEVSSRDVGRGDSGT